MDFVAPVEVDCLINSLRRLRIQDFGKERWIEQHLTVIKLNQQCVLEAKTEGREELTRDLVVQHGKTPVLVQDLFSVYVWKMLVAPALDKRDSIVIYSIGYHELILINLLEIIMYNGDGCESLGDHALDLVDYCVQRVTQLIGLVLSGFLDAEHQESSPENMTFKLGIHCISLVYYLIDKLDALPLSVAGRLVRFHDTPCLLTELLHCRPWQRRTPKGFERYTEGKWTQVCGEELQRLSKVEAQSWCALRQLLFNGPVMQNYEWNDFRCREISKNVGLMHEVLLDQLTPLVELKQYLATLSIQRQPQTQASKRGAFILEEIPELQNEFKKEVEDFGLKNIIQLQQQIFFDKTVTLQLAKSLNEAYNVEKIVALEEKSVAANNTCGQCARPAEKKCSRCIAVAYCSRECQVKHWPVHKPFCN